MENDNNNYDIEMNDLIQNHTYSCAKYYINLLNSEMSLLELYDFFKLFTSSEFYIYFLNNGTEDIHYIISNFIIHKMRNTLLSNENSYNYNLTTIHYYIENELNKKDCKNIHDIRLLNLLELLCQIQKSESLEDFSVYLYHLNQVFFKNDLCHFIIEDNIYISYHLLERFIGILKFMTPYEILDYIVYQQALYYTDYFIFSYAYHDLINKTMYLCEREFMEFYNYFIKKKKLQKINFYYNLYLMYEMKIKIMHSHKNELLKIYTDFNKEFKLSNFDTYTICNLICLTIKKK